MKNNAIHVYEYGNLVYGIFVIISDKYDEETIIIESFY